MTRPHPQRISPVAPIGSLFKRPSAPRAGRDAAPHKEPDYLALVRQCPCLYCGLDPSGEAAHVRYASAAFGKASGLQKKPEDRWALPLCGSCHRTAAHAQHQRNEEAFWRDLGINPLLTAERLHAQRGDLVAMRAVIFVAISERGEVMSETDYIDDEDETLTTAETRARAAESNDAFIAAMSRAIKRKRETATFGVTVDRSPPIHARRIRPVAPLSYMSSPAALCEEIGKRKRG